MKRLLLFAFIGLLLTIVVVQEKMFHKRGLDIARSSFEAGCIMEGRDFCLSQYNKDDDFTTNMRGFCFELILNDCQRKTLGFMNWMGSKK